MRAALFAPAPVVVLVKATAANLPPARRPPADSSRRAIVIVEAMLGDHDGRLLISG